MKTQHDDHFRTFKQTLERKIQAFSHLSKAELLERQKQQVESLQALEEEFRHLVIAHPWGAGVYKAFIRMIREERNNILSARPFFRERSNVFTAEISKALQTQSHVSLYKFHFNYQFVLFAMRQCRWHPNSKVARKARDIERVRTDLIEQNMPLAISRARLFWKYARAHLSYMDLVQIASDGLASGIDKFVGPYSKAFRSVILGRITGNFIEENSETMLHFFPSDRRKLYNANKAMKEHHMGEVSFTELAAEVNHKGKGSYKTDRDEIAGLVLASQIVSADAQVRPGDEDTTQADNIEKYAADESQRPDVMCEAAEAHASLRGAYAMLTTLERKLLRMKGVEAVPL